MFDELFKCLDSPLQIAAFEGGFPKCLSPTFLVPYTFCVFGRGLIFMIFKISHRVIWDV